MRPALRSILTGCALLTLCALLPACQIFGPNAIQTGRLPYNEVIQRTSKVQTFANIIRARNYEPTAFLDVTQINAGVLAQGIGLGALTNIGQGKLGSVNLSLEYQEAPTIQYQPLTGAALISQLSTPITTASISNLYNSDVPLASLLSLTVDRITPGFYDYASAINALIALESYGAILITAVATESPPAKSGKNSSDSSSKDGDDQKSNPALVISLLRTHPYTGRELESPETRDKIDHLWCRLVTLLLPHVPCLSIGQLILASSVPPGREKKLLDQTVNFLRTRSAIGILKAAATAPAPLIGFVPEPLFEKIRGEYWNREPALSQCDSTSFYTLLPEDEGPRDHPNANPEITRQTQAFIENSIYTTEGGIHIRNCLYTTSNFLDPDNVESARLENRLQGLRRFLLIIVSSTELPNSYVSYFDGTSWYSIDADDRISKENFELISELLTIQATATTPPTLTAITVGPR
jgi:hypothetical protein